MYKKIITFINQPFMLVILTALCSSWLTTYIGFQYQVKLAENKQQYQLHQSQEANVQEAGKKIAVAIGERKFALYRVINQLDEGDMAGFEQNWDSYYQYVTSWNNDIFVYEVLLQELCTSQDRCPNLNSVNKQFVITHRAVLALKECVQKHTINCAKQYHTVNEDYESLNHLVDGFVASLKA